MANEHIFQNNLIITGSVTASQGFYGDGSGLTGITAVAEWDGSRNGDANITGSFTVSGSSANVDFTNAEAGVSGSFSGSFEGDGSGLTGLTLPSGVVSGSAQISYTGITDIPANIISSSAQFSTITDPFTGSFTGSFTGDGSGLTNLTLPSGVVSGSAQISYTGITDVPANIISSSAQFTTLTNPFTGSFTGSFTGDGSGLTGITATAVGGIFQTGSNTGAIKTNDTSYTSIASGQYSFAGGGRYVTASADYTTALGGIESKATATYATAVGGYGNIAKGVASVALGYANTASGSCSIVIGGTGNISNGSNTAILAGSGSSIDNAYSVIAGGYGHSILGARSFIGGGLNSQVTKDGAEGAILGGTGNCVKSARAVILGGSNLTTTRDNVVVVTNLYVTGSGTDNDTTGKHTGTITMANRTVSPTSADIGTLMVSGSNLFFYGSGGWTQIN